MICTTWPLGTTRTKNHAWQQQKVKIPHNRAKTEANFPYKAQTTFAAPYSSIDLDEERDSIGMSIDIDHSP